MIGNTVSSHIKKFYLNLEYLNISPQLFPLTTLLFKNRILDTSFLFTLEVTVIVELLLRGHIKLNEKATIVANKVFI